MTTDDAAAGESGAETAAYGGPFSREGMPGIAEIVEYWRQQDPLWLASATIARGELFCFGCGWLPPVNNWSGAGPFLDRANLQDHRVAAQLLASLPATQ